MATINELIAKIENAELRERIAAEVDKLAKQKKFGLVFEEHLPECTPLYDIPVKKGGKVALKAGKVNDVYTVLKIEDGKALCLNKDKSETTEFAVDELVTVAEFGEAIYPCLKPIDSVCNAPDSDLWHTLIEADNYHALQLLEYLYAGKVDCIYIDPPYNTGARDWKYNNDYVDGNDQYRHSKWLSMMQKRLKIAKRLLNPNDSVLIVTIDEKEYLHLGCLLEEMFPDARIQMISTMINPAVVARAGEFGRSGEYIFYVLFGNAAPSRIPLEREWVSSKGRTHTGNIRWDLLKRSGTGATRKDSPGGFYPIYINPENGKIEKIGVPLPEGVSEAPKEEGLFCLLPIREDGSEGRWQWSTATLAEGLKQGRVKVGGDKNRGFTVYRLASAEFAKITNGEFNECGRGINNEIIVEDIDTEHVLAVPGDIWKISSHDATQYGSRYLGNIFGTKRFTFPKSLYAVRDCINFFTSNKPNALVVDFFAGSGTTLHAVSLLNAADNGHRRCIIVTNNEVSTDEAKALTDAGFHPGDAEWEKLGIARYVTWPRVRCCITGKDINGNPLPGTYGVMVDQYIADNTERGKFIKKKVPAYPYMEALQMADGFKANAAFFKLGFLDKTKVSLGMQFKEMLPTLWMKAGAIGKCPTVEASVPDMLILPENKMAILNDENRFGAFAEKLAEHPEIEVVYLVTDYEAAFVAMTQALPGKKTYQLYRDYLDNFRINAGRNSR